jgi:hypothetical protein
MAFMPSEEEANKCLERGAVAFADMLFCGTEVVARRGHDVKIVYCSSIYPYINRKPAS